MKAQPVPLELARIVDDLGAVKAKIAKLQEEEDELKDILTTSGMSFVDGGKYRASISWHARANVDWRTIAQRFEPSRQLIAAHTVTSEPVPTIRVSARKTTK